jgi:hypothetical protein
MIATFGWGVWRECHSVCEATAEIEASLATKEIEKELINLPEASATLSNSASSR